ncbi:MAG: AI-2E family transporter, partial [Edaphobacter sp.]
MPTSYEETAWKQITLFLLTLSILIVCALILHPFYAAITGAIVLAVITQRPYDWLASKIRNRSAAAALALILVVLAVITPSFFLAQDLGQQALAAVRALRDDSNQQKLSEFLGNHPLIASRVEAVTDSIDLSHAAQTTATFLGSKLAGLLGNSFRVITQLVVMLFILFFLFRDRAFAIRLLRSVLPLRE